MTRQEVASCRSWAIFIFWCACAGILHRRAWRIMFRYIARHVPIAGSRLLNAERSMRRAGKAWDKKHASNVRSISNWPD